MSNDTPRSSRTGRARQGLSAVMSGAFRLLVDLLVISLWVLLLTLVFLETGWPRWAFYGVLFGGIGLYVAVTAAWAGGDREK
ncbi:hypothetical protein HYG81_16730 [Natrinema zhouii]|uniref:DUF8119 domain-containing protein n=2 Tax=Natrinema zhouii TaxID=1710539 RepID=A0A7D6GZB2_9EURY|nr:hypothetical protein [Natrinema zhouii]QLK25705.1 hypothetical protein HYG81_16730 [Natrinema zhouii]